MHDPIEGMKPQSNVNGEYHDESVEAIKHLKKESEHHYKKLMSAVERSKKHKEHDMSKEVIMAGGYPGYGGYGAGVPGLGNVGLVGLIGLNSLGHGLGGYGGYGGHGGDKCCNNDKTAHLEQTIATLQGQFASTAAIEDDISGVDTRLSGAIKQIEKEICDLRYENANQTATLLAAIAAGTQAVKDQQTQFKFGDLERQLDVAQSGGPIVRAGVFKQCDPCHEQNQISNINQVLVQIGNGLVGLQNAVAALTSAK